MEAHLEKIKTNYAGISINFHVPTFSSIETMIEIELDFNIARNR